MLDAIKRNRCPHRRESISCSWKLGWRPNQKIWCKENERPWAIEVSYRYSFQGGRCEYWLLHLEDIEKPDNHNFVERYRRLRVLKCCESDCNPDSLSSEDHLWWLRCGTIERFCETQPVVIRQNSFRIFYWKQDNKSSHRLNNQHGYWVEEVDPRWWSTSSIAKRKQEASGIQWLRWLIWRDSTCWRCPRTRSVEESYETCEWSPLDQVLQWCPQVFWDKVDQKARGLQQDSRYFI